MIVLDCSSILEPYKGIAFHEEGMLVELKRISKHELQQGLHF